MAIHTLRDDELTFSTEGGKLLLSVPYDSANAVHESLRALGVESTLLLDAEQRTATIQPWEVITEARVRSLLDVGDEELPRW